MIVKTFVEGIVETNCYIVSDEEKNCVMIDCDGSGKGFADYFQQNGLKPSYLLLTHGHFDHVGAIEPIKKTYPDCKICVGEKDKDLLEQSKKADLSLKEGDSIEVGKMKFLVLETPGHTKGGLCYQIGDLLFTGDTLFYRDCGRVDLLGGSWDEMKASLKKLKSLNGDFKVYPGHGPSSTLEEERAQNQYMNQE